MDYGKWVNASCEVKGVYYENYNCDNKTGYHTVKVLTSGKHTQQFNFSGQIAYANNFAFNQTTISNFDLGNYSNTTSNSSGD